MGEEPNGKPATAPVPTPEVKGEDESSVIKQIVSTETSEGEDRLLDIAPEIDATLVSDIEPPKSLLLLGLKIALGVFAFLGFASFVFFTSQLSGMFDFATSTFGIPNTSNELSSTNSEIISLKTDDNFYRFLQIKAYLDEFSYYGDSYLRSHNVSQSQTASNREIRDASDEIGVLKGKIKTSFDKIKEEIVVNFTAPLYGEESDVDLQGVYVGSLENLIKGKAALLADSADEVAKRDYKNYIHTLKLVGNADLKNLIVNTDFDALDDAGLYELIKKVNAVIVNDLSTIQKIKDQRINWSDIINEIDLRTIEVDKYFSANYYDDLGGIRYTSYDFDGKGPSITITGETKRFDTTNFSMIAELIDKLNASPLFENAEMKSFSKTGSLDSGWTASLKLSLDLEGMEPITE